MNDKVVRLSFVGDLMCQEPLVCAWRKDPATFDFALSHVREVFSQSDYVLGNLETPVAKSHRYSHELMSFNAPLAFARAVKSAGIDFVSLANNHIWDCGAKGVDETVSAVREAGLDATGAYITREERDDVFVKEIKGVKIAVVACTYETNYGRPEERMLPEETWKVDLLKKPLPYPFSFWFPVRRAVSNLLSRALKDRLAAVKAALRTPRRFRYCPESVASSEIGRECHESYRRQIEAKVRLARTLADIVVVMPHVGGQHNPSPGRYHEYTMKWLADAGADIIMAAHAHAPQKIRWIGQTLAAYSLGDFMMWFSPDRYPCGTLTNYALVCEVDIDIESKRIASARVIPVRTEENTAGPHTLESVYHNAKKESEQERVEIEVDALMNRVIGGVGPFAVASSYEVPMR